MFTPPFTPKMIPVGAAGALKIDLPLLEFGSGDPKVLILVGLHGDERTGLFVVNRLLESLDLQSGTLRIIPAANPLAQILNQREEPFGRKDLNRTFPGDSEKDFTFRLANVLLNQARECRDCVIDLHTLGMHSRLMTIFMNHGTRQVRERSLELIHAFSPHLIWQLDTSSSLGRRWGGSMGPTMANAGIINFAVEMAEHDHVQDSEISHAVDGILRVLHLLGMTTNAPDSPARVPLMFAYRDVTADHSGFFEPRNGLLAFVRTGNLPAITEGDLIGTFVDPVTFETSEVRSKYTGPLVAISGREFVRTGDGLYNIGEVKPWRMLADATVEMIQKFALAIKPDSKEHLQRSCKIAEGLAAWDNADFSICQAAIWLSALKSKEVAYLHVAESYLRSLPDIDDETRGRILDCISDGAPTTPEAQVVPNALQQATAEE